MVHLGRFGNVVIIFLLILFVCFCHRGTPLVHNTGFILVGLFTRIYFSTAYESGSLCMYHAMTFYESFGLEIAYKIIKRKLASRVYVFTNLTQVWSGDETVKYNDQIFMIIGGNVPYLDWASNYIPIHDTANETTMPENTSLSDTNEAFTFRENFIDQKYGTHAPNQTTFSDLNFKLTTNSSPPTTQRLNLNTHQNSHDRISKGDRFPPNVTFPDLDTDTIREADNAIDEKEEPSIRENQQPEAANVKREADNSIDEKEEPSIRENQRPFREQKARAGRRNLRRRELMYDERNLERIYPRMRQQRYAQQQNPPEMYDRVPPRYFQQRNAPDWYDRDTPKNYEDNEPDWIENNLPKYFERGNAREMYERDNPENDEPDAQNWAYEERVRQTTNAGQNLYRNGRRPVWSNNARTSRSRGIMDIIKSFINPFASNEATITERAKMARGNNKMRRKTRARKINENYQPYNNIRDTDDYENFRNYDQNNPANDYVFVQRAGNRNFNYGQKQKNERRTMRSRRSRGRKNERQGARARQTIRVARAGRANGMENSYYQHQMNYAREMNRRENVQGNMKYHYAPSAVDTYRHEHVSDNHKPINIHDNEDINYHVPGIHRPQAENNFAHFHQINEAADHLNELTPLHNPPPHPNVLHDHQSNPNSPRLHAEHFADHDHHYVHQEQHVIRPQHEQHQHYQAQPVYNPHNLPVLHKTVNRQPYHMIHHPEVIHLQVNPRSRVRSPPKSKQFRKVKNAPGNRKGRANPRAARARSKMVTAFYQHNNVPDIGAQTTIQFVDVLQYHYEPRQDMRMIQ